MSTLDGGKSDNSAIEPSGGRPVDRLGSPAPASADSDREAVRKVISSLALSDGQIVCDVFELLSYVHRKSR
jgi:hypothetical protein